MKILDFVHEYHDGCLKDPRQQSTKVEKIKSMNHELSETYKIIENSCLSMFLDAFEDHNKIHPNELFLLLSKKNIAISNVTQTHYF